MARTDGHLDIGLAVLSIRYFKDCTQADLSRESGIDQGLISDYENGKVKPGPKNRSCVAKTVGADLEWFEQLVARCRGIRQLFETAGRTGWAGGSGKAEAVPGLEGKILEAVREGMAPLFLQLSPAEHELAPRAEDRIWAEARWASMESLSAEDQSVIVEVLEGDERSWALAELLCRASETLKDEAPDEALRLARLAVRLAEQCPGSESWRGQLRSWCERFVTQASGNSGRLGPLAPLLV